MPKRSCSQASKPDLSYAKKPTTSGRMLVAQMSLSRISPPSRVDPMVEYLTVYQIAISMKSKTSMLKFLFSCSYRPLFYFLVRHKDCGAGSPLHRNPPKKAKILYVFLLHGTGQTDAGPCPTIAKFFILLYIRIKMPLIESSDAILFFARNARKLLQMQANSLLIVTPPTAFQKPEYKYISHNPTCFTHAL